MLGGSSTRKVHLRVMDEVYEASARVLGDIVELVRS